jgi:hypothetical protein
MLLRKAKAKTSGTHCSLVKDQADMPAKACWQPMLSELSNNVCSTDVWDSPLLGEGQAGQRAAQLRVLEFDGCLDVGKAQALGLVEQQQDGGLQEEVWSWEGRFRVA